MKGSRRPTLMFALVAAVLTVLVAGPAASAAPGGGSSVFDHWTAERMANAIPRDLVVDERGLGYLRLPSGELEPYGHSTPARPWRLEAVASPTVKPDGNGKPGGGDNTGPSVTDQNPAEGATIGGTHTFSATVTDASGVKSVTFVITDPGGSNHSFNASNSGGTTWSVSITGFTTGTGWSWYVVAKDGAARGGNTTTTNPISFQVDTGSSGGGGGGSTGDCGATTNAEWICDGDVQTAAGRIYFEMPYRGPFWSGYVCSGTAVTDSTTKTISVVITAAHCVYDDANKVFARNVLFIPNQAGSANGTNTDCTDDPLGCWAPSHGVVDDHWANQTWPDNIPWDYAYYVVPDSAHQGAGASGALDALAGTLPVKFTAASQGTFTHALGYSYDYDPQFMYCAENLGTDASLNTLFLGSCGLSGGASGGPWVQPMDTTTGSGPIIAVNSYGYSNQPGMGAARLTGSAGCIFTEAQKDYTNTTRGAIIADSVCP